MEETKEQPENRHDILENKKKHGAEHLLPYQYKKGQSGNPTGRPKGISLKEYVKSKFHTMTDEEREEFLNGLPKDTIWEMGEGRPHSEDKLAVKGDITIKRVSFDDYNSDTIQPETGQS